VYGQSETKTTVKSAIAQVDGTLCWAPDPRRHTGIHKRGPPIPYSWHLFWGAAIIDPRRSRRAVTVHKGMASTTSEAFSSVLIASLTCRRTGWALPSQMTSTHSHRRKEWGAKAVLASPMTMEGVRPVMVSNRRPARRRHLASSNRRGEPRSPVHLGLAERKIPLCIYNIDTVVLLLCLKCEESFRSIETQRWVNTIWLMWATGLCRWHSPQSGRLKRGQAERRRRA